MLACQICELARLVRHECQGLPFSGIDIVAIITAVNQAAHKLSFHSNVDKVSDATGLHMLYMRKDVRIIVRKQEALREIIAKLPMIEYRRLVFHSHARTPTKLPE